MRLRHVLVAALGLELAAVGGIVVASRPPDLPCGSGVASVDVSVPAYRGWRPPGLIDQEPTYLDTGVFHPVIAAERAIVALDVGEPANAEEMGRLLVDHADDGWERYGFPFAFGGHDFAPGWISGLAQGHALSVASRLYQRTGDPQWLESAHRFYATLVPPSPVARWDGPDYWIEEYPSDPPDPVLNGFIAALFGLADYVAVTGSTDARSVLLAGLNTLDRHVEAFLGPFGAVYYDLDHKSQLPPGSVYWDTHRRVLDWAADMTGSACFRAAARVLGR